MKKPEMFGNDFTMTAFDMDTEPVKETEKEKEAEKEKVKDTKNRQFYLSAGVSAGSMKPIIEGILEINKHDDEQEEEVVGYKRKPIKIIVDSFGGSIYDGFGLMGAIDTSKTPVHTYCYSKAMSMGFAIFIMGHQRFATDTATFMYHNGATTIQDCMQGIEENLNQGKRIVGMIDRFVVKYTDLTQKYLDEVKASKINLYLFAEEAIEHGILDEVLESTRDSHRAK